jgi:uncharacterized membrane protein YfcA
MTEPFTVSHIASFVVAGFVAGVMNSIAGGGTLITFPTLIFVGIPSIPANATNTVALLPGILSSGAGYRKKFRSVSRWLILFAPVSLLGGFAGGILLVQTPSRVFDAFVPFLILFATMLFMAQGILGRVLKMRGESAQGRLQSRRWIFGAVMFQFAVALYGGYFGAGIGILMLASLGMLGFENVHEMNTLKVMLAFLINVVAAGYFIWSGLINWSAAGIMMVGTIAGGYTGAHFAQQVPQRIVRAFISAIGLIISAVMFYRAFLSR